MAEAVTERVSRYILDGSDRYRPSTQRAAGGYGGSGDTALLLPGS